MIVVHILSWFPDAGKPLNGNFILRQIETIGAETESFILHHTEEDYPKTRATAVKPICGLRFTVCGLRNRKIEIRKSQIANRKPKIANRKKGEDPSSPLTTNC